MRKIKELMSDCCTPVSMYLRISGNNKSLLESIPRDREDGRYSIVAINPVHHLQYKDNTFFLDGTAYAFQDPLKELERLTTTTSTPLPESLPFQGGAIGYASYDLAFVYEATPFMPKDDLQLPEMQFFLYETFLIFDHQKESITLVAGNQYSHRTEQALDQELIALEQALLTPSKEELRVPTVEKLAFSSNFTQEEFETVVKKAKQYIEDGDLFQVVPSQRLSSAFHGSAFDYYRHLRLSNPSSYLYFLPFDDVTIIGSSPESLVRVKQQTVTTNPIAGTRKRGQTKAEDQALADELLHDEKERAEHQMLVDLGRNDIGKVAVSGSVHLPLFMQIERYRHVMHLVSVVEATLADQKTAMDALKATLPAGTVSGAPKIRAMQRIYEWEPTRRGLYAGAVGYLSQDGQADFAIAIRTMVLKDGQAYVQAGAGIVYDSHPTNEYHETLQKAKALLEVKR
ncbi:anthranilate synthase component I [Enterococcus camelliae]|uniref:Anthranilate synthase component 1 n=1 Tax=Enterococcus camelliae TaxID=453959 RepID=A0ABW5TGZ4_9ENTE